MNSNGADNKFVAIGIFVILNPYRGSQAKNTGSSKVSALELTPDKLVNRTKKLVTR